MLIPIFIDSGFGNKGKPLAVAERRACRITYFHVMSCHLALLFFVTFGLDSDNINQFKWTTVARAASFFFLKTLGYLVSYPLGSFTLFSPIP
jgi:hypothetical protein